MNKIDLINLVKKISASEGTEEEIDDMIVLLKANVSDPNVTDYIFYADLSAEEIVDKCLNYKPIILRMSYDDPSFDN